MHFAWTAQRPSVTQLNMNSIDNLPAFVRDRFDTARKDGALTFYDTQVSVLRCHDIPVNNPILLQAFEC
jgi:hypothetical protein